MAGEFDGRDLTWYWGQLEHGRDVQPQYTEELKGVLAGWTLGDTYVVSARRGNVGQGPVSDTAKDSGVALDGIDGDFDIGKESGVEGYRSEDVVSVL